jgi:hypothetical protein
LEVVRNPESRGFAEAWSALDAFFGPRGELEAREAVETFVRDGLLPYDDDMYGHYRLIVAWDGEQFAGVRDCYVDFDPVARVCVVALSHSWVAPEHRRSGLAAIFRAVPVTLARELMATNADTRDYAILVIAEMEPVEADDPNSVVRLIAYGRSGFSAMDPQRIPYSQPDFRQVEGSPFNSIPLLGVVRWVGHEGKTGLPPYLAAALPRLFHQAHRKYLPRDRIDPLEVHALRALSRQECDVGLLPLPKNVSEVGLLSPLVRSAVLAGYPPMMRGERPEIGDPAAEIEAVIARWGRAVG